MTQPDPPTVAADPLDFAGQLITESLHDLAKARESGHPVTDRKIALAHALSAFSHALAARRQLELLMGQVESAQQPQVPQLLVPTGVQIPRA